MGKEEGKKATFVIVFFCDFCARKLWQDRVHQGHPGQDHQQVQR